MNYVAYYRVSTKKQGKSGLGLEAQRRDVTRFIKSVDGTLVGEFTDIESGGKDDREHLQEAIAMAVSSGAPIVVKKLDRLSRGGFKITSHLEEIGVEYIDCESPNDGALIKDIKMSVAKDERAKISQRITAALDVIKRNIEEKGYHISSTGQRITSLGNPENLGGKKAVRRSVEVRRRKAEQDPNNQKAAAMIEVLREAKGMSFRKIAEYLNEKGFKTSRGNDFSDVQVGNLYKRYIAA